jgi:hypothetical protein
MLPAGNYIGEVLSVNSSEYSVQVKINNYGGYNSATPIVATPLGIHGGNSDGSSGLSMPEVGSIVFVSIPSGSNSSQTAYILGYAREPSRRKQASEYSAELDPIQNMMEPLGYFRGSSNPDILPGDYSISSYSGSRLSVTSSGDAVLSSSTANIGVGSTFGKTYIKASANESYSKYDVASIDILRDRIQLTANTSDTSARDLLKTDGKITNDTFISIGGDSAVSIEYSGSKKPAIFSISKTGEILIRGSKVVIDSDNNVATNENNNKIQGDLTTEVSGKYSLVAGDINLESKGNFSTIVGGNMSVSAASDTSIYSGGMHKHVVSGPSVLKQGPRALIPGLNDGLTLQCDSGSTVIKSGSKLPGTNTLSKPQIRLEADSGGDVVVQSSMSIGGAMTTGSIVMSSPMPASITGAGGLGNYGIVLNSPLCMIGNYPGVELTPPNLPNLFLPPLPVVGNEPLAKAIPVVTALTSLAALLTAYPPTAPVGALFSTALAATTPIIPTRSVFAL